MAGGQSLRFTVYGEDHASKALDKIAASAGKTDKALDGLKKIAGAVAIGAAFGKIVGAASNLEQSMGAVDAVFKGNAAQVKAWAADTTDSIRLSKNEFQQLATVLGSQLKNAGFEDFTDKTHDLIQVGADLAAQFGGTTTEAVQALSSALKGERDPIEAYGVSLNQAAVNAEALEIAQGNAAKAADPLIQKQATINLIMEQTADAQGAAARESETFAAKLEDFKATAENVAAQVGGPLLDSLGNLLTTAGEAATSLVPLATAAGDLLGAVLKLPAPVLAAGAAFAGFLKWGDDIGAMFTGLKVKATDFKGTMASLGKTFAAGGAFALAGAAVGAWQQNAQHNAEATRFWADQVKSLQDALVAANGEWDSSVQAVQDQQITGQAVFQKLVAITGDYGTALKALKGDAEALPVLLQQIKDAGASDTEVGIITNLARQYGVTAEEAKKAAEAQREFEGLQRGREADSARMQGLADAYARAGDEAANAEPPVSDLEQALSDGASAASEMDASIQSLQLALDTLAGSEVTAAQATREHEAKIRAVAGAARDHAQALADEKQAADDLKTAQDNLGKSQEDGGTTAADVAQAERDLAEAHDRVAESADGQAESLDELANNAQTMTGRAFELTGGMDNYDASVRAAIGTMQQQRAQFIASAKDAGLSQTAAEQLADAQGLIPSDVRTAYEAIRAQEAKDAAEGVDSAARNIPSSVHTNISASDGASAVINGVRVQLQSLDGYVATTYVRTVTSSTATGSLTRQAEGGFIRGPGTGTSDSIPAMLSNGEFVIKASQTAKHRPLLEAINNGRQGFASGGPVSSARLAGISSSQPGARQSIVLGALSDITQWVRDLAEKAKTGTAAMKAYAAQVARVNASQGQGRRVLSLLAQTYDQQTVSLERMRDRLSSLVDSRRSLASSTAGSIGGFGGGILGFSEQRVTPGSVINGLRFNAQRIQRFGSQLRTLKARGLSASLLSQIAGGGDDGMRVAQTLAHASRAEIAQINRYAGIAARSAAQSGNLIGDTMYGKQIATLTRQQTVMLRQQGQIAAATLSLATALNSGIELRSDGVALARIVARGQRALTRRGA